MFIGLESGNIVRGVFTPVLAKHVEAFSLIDCISVGADMMKRNFKPMRNQVAAWQRSDWQNVTAKVAIYEVFVEGKLEAPKHLFRPSQFHIKTGLVKYNLLAGTVGLTDEFEVSR